MNGSPGHHVLNSTQEEKAMKKKVLAIALVTAFTGMGVAQAADVTAQA